MKREREKERETDRKERKKEEEKTATAKTTEGIPADHLTSIQTGKWGGLCLQRTPQFIQLPQGKTGVKKTKKIQKNIIIHASSQEPGGC